MRCSLPGSVTVLFFLFLLFFPFLSFADSGRPPERTALYLDEISIGNGYAWGSLKKEREGQSIYPVFVRFGFNANGLFGILSRSSTLQLTLEPFVNAVSGPEDGVETGCGVGIRYLRAVSGKVDLFVEGSIAPMIYTIDTVEQGKAGFNFLDQAGAGLRYRFSAENAVFCGYRWRHLSHAGIAGRSNDGIESDAVIIGFSWLL